MVFGNPGQWMIGVNVALVVTVSVISFTVPLLLQVVLSLQLVGAY